MSFLWSFFFDRFSFFLNKEKKKQRKKMKPFTLIVCMVFWIGLSMAAPFDVSELCVLDCKSSLEELKCKRTFFPKKQSVCWTCCTRPKEVFSSIIN
ncbi:hypothetical protein BY458DRAFT_500523 [Sporodiniella umbellata]|nr:hypothetical protein BY458DRAFT_500523 [Sporodiniella umbellata]